MIISEQNKYIYLACPKTGTVSTEKFLLEQDPSAFRNKIIIAEKLLTFRGHETAKNIKDKLQNDFNKYKVIGFVRDPYSRLVSSYFFYKKKGKSVSINTRKRGLMHNLRYLSAKILPFSIWALVYPYKSNKEFFVDDKNETIVQHIGLFESLNKDFEQILRNLDLNFDIAKIKKLNKSNHALVNTFFKNRFFKKLINLKVREDLEFYNSIKQRNNDIKTIPFK